MTVLARYTEDEVDDLIAFLDELDRRTESREEIHIRIDKQRLQSVLEEIGPLPEDSLFIGRANDGFPILLDLEDPTPGSMLFVGAKYSGKTVLLKTIASAIEMMHKPESVKFAVITGSPGKWRDLTDSPNLIGIFSIEQPSTTDFINGLTNWAHVNGDKTQTVILLIDGLEILDSLDYPTQQNMAWLLKSGPEHRVWPIATIRAENWHLTNWHYEFATKVSGYIEPFVRKGMGVNLPAAPSKNQFLLADNLSFSVSAWL